VGFEESILNVLDEQVARRGVVATMAPELVREALDAPAAPVPEEA
jgi:hypothetical protein